MEADHASTASDRQVIVHTVAEIAAARDLVRRATATHLSDRRIDDAVLATSELVSNAIEHGDGDVEVRVSVAPDGVEVRVASPSADVPRIGDGPAPPHAIRGRGLMIVDALSDSMTISGERGDVAVTCRFEV